MVFFTFINVNCTLSLYNCSTYFESNTFKKLFFMPPGNFSERLKYTSDIAYDDSQEKILDLANIFNTSFLNSENHTVSGLGASARARGKYPIVYVYKDNDFNPGIFLISALEKYKKHFDFIGIRNPDERILTQLKVTVPKLFLLWQGYNDTNLQVIAANGELNYINAKKFCEHYIQNKILKEEKEAKVFIENPSDRIREDVGYINNTRSFREHCSKKKKPCVLSFLDGRANKNAMKLFDDNMISLDRVMIHKKNGTFFLFLDKWYLSN